MSVRARTPMGWLAAMRRYLAVLTFGNLLWELAQLPLYTLWHDAPPRIIVRAVLHCTAGDLVIGITALVAAITLFGSEAWPTERHAAVLIAVVLISVTYAMISEYLNTVVRGSWAYTPAMPTLPLIGTGLAPLAQWIVVPTLALTLARTRARDPGPQTAIPRSFQGG